MTGFTPEHESYKAQKDLIMNAARLQIRQRRRAELFPTLLDEIMELHDEVLELTRSRERIHKAGERPGKCSVCDVIVQAQALA